MCKTPKYQTVCFIIFQKVTRNAETSLGVSPDFSFQRLNLDSFKVQAISILFFHKDDDKIITVFIVLIWVTD